MYGDENKNKRKDVGEGENLFMIPPDEVVYVMMLLVHWVVTRLASYVVVMVG